MAKKTNKQTNQMNYISTQLVIEKLQNCKDKERATNNLIIKMLNASNLDKVKIEISKNGGFNRGSLVECLVKSAILNYLYIDNSKISKSNKGENDLNLSKRSKDLLSDLGLINKAYEIKCISSLARASKIDYVNACVNGINQVIIVDLRAKSLGCKLVKLGDLIVYQNCKPTDNAYNSIKDYKNEIELKELNDIVGLD